MYAPAEGPTPRFKPAPIFNGLLLLVCLCCLVGTGYGNKRRPPGVGPRAVVVDERLAALRAEPALTAPLVQRLGRGRAVAIVGAARAPEGVSFYRVAVTRRTRGWLQADSVVAPARAHEDERLLRLIQASDDFERVARARIFLDEFPRSPLRPRVLLLLGAAAVEAAARLSRDAERRLREDRLPEQGPPLHSYFLNYTGLDRYRRQGVVYTFDAATRQFRYDGAAWRELVRRYPRSPEATEARRRLDASTAAPR
ncbi:MAG TPA: hypothetical protein VF546_17140 [Pyrinomonadaceae bacterium]|jgi:hypothetical protein